MSFVRLPFPSIPFVQGGHPLEQKKVGAVPAVALLEFAAGFSDPGWCRRAHVIYVVRGALTLELEGRTETVEEGESCVLDAGTPHRARNAGAVPVVLFIVSDCRPPA